jgi:predicted  nucleic acid-binding Zn-ribbon protein
LPITSSEALDQGSIFDSFNRPYTPSYNSASGFEGAFSDQDDLWSGTGSHFEEAEFAFGQPFSKTQNSLSTLAYDPETADNYNNLDSVLLAAHSFNQSNSGTARSGTSSHINDRGSTGLPTQQFADQKHFREPEEKSPITSPLLGATSPIHTRHSSFGSHLDPTPALDSEQAWMQSLGQRISLNDDSGIQSRHLQQQQQQRHQHRHTASYQDFSNQSHFAPVFEEEGHQNDYSGQQFPSYTYSQLPSASQYENSVKQSEGEPQLPLLAISDTTMQDAAFSHASRAPDGRTWAEAGNWNTGAPNDYYPLSYSNTQHNNMGHLNNSTASPAPPPSALRPGNSYQGPQQGKRQDSYEQIRKFLRLDVDMGFVSQQQHHLQEPAGLMTARKRSNSDFGPSYFGVKDEEVTSPPLFTVVPDGVSDKTPVALSSGVDWVTEAARQRKLQQANQGDMRNDTVVMTMQQQNFTMDPNLLLHQQQQHLSQQTPLAQQPRYNPASGPMRQRDVSNLRGASGPYQHDRTLSSGSSAATPWLPISPTVPAANANSTYASLGASSGQSQLMGMRRSHSASRHRRGAQSEDLSQLARSSNPAEFLHRITAPDGSLAPPNTLGLANSLSGSMGNASTPASRLNPAYQTSHDRYQSGGSSNHSTPSSIESNEASSEAQERQAAMNRYRSNSSLENTTSNRKNYSQTALPTYSSLLNNIGDPNPMQTMMAGPSNGTAFPYPVAQVTTTATQAASASRRKNEAIHVCPIPGCGSTFTRKFNLNGHIRSHTGARPYECREPGCGKSFARSFDLSRHEKLHAGIKPHNCESCGKSFARADALSRHLRNDAGNGGCAARFNEEGEEDGDDSKLTPSISAPAVRLRSGSSASSSLDSMDDSYRNREEEQQQDNQRSTDSSLVKRESRFKGYVL